jgi:hypothetical protein
VSVTQTELDGIIARKPVATSPRPTATKSPTPNPTPTAYVIGDLNGDRAINMSDVMILAASFNTVRGDGIYVEAYDLNSDGAINMSDVMIIAAKFNTAL